VLLFATVIVVFGRWKGVGALAGLTMRLAVIVVFVLPSLLDGNNAVLVALVGTSVIAFVALYLAHGVNPATSVALISTFAALTVTGALSWLFIRAAKFTGYTDDSTQFLDALSVPIDPRGILLADTKFEFGEFEGRPIVIDEVLTPDSSRFWPAAQYAPGKGQPSFDKQFVRDWLETTGWDKNSPPPALPDEVALRTRAKYIEAYELLSGRSFPWK
jgi:hypothetical protein